VISNEGEQLVVRFFNEYLHILDTSRLILPHPVSLQENLPLFIFLFSCFFCPATVTFHHNKIVATVFLAHAAVACDLHCISRELVLDSDSRVLKKKGNGIWYEVHARLHVSVNGRVIDKILYVG
jgi:hypothetical protein